jgi:hypothetical protein
LLVGFTRLALASSLIVIETLSVLLLPALNIPDGGLVGMGGGLMVAVGVGDELVLRLLGRNFVRKLGYTEQ